jgi:hypothetical protein
MPAPRRPPRHPLSLSLSLSLSLYGATGLQEGGERQRRRRIVLNSFPADGEPPVPRLLIVRPAARGEPLGPSRSAPPPISAVLLSLARAAVLDSPARRAGPPSSSPPATLPPKEPSIRAREERGSWVRVRRLCRNAAFTVSCRRVYREAVQLIFAYRYGAQFAVRATVASADALNLSTKV